jgi:NAD-dependent deacetylase
MYIPRQTKKERKIIFISGAGLDAPSGIQTFRGNDGLWNGHDIKIVCNELTWKTNYHLVHKFYNERRLELKDKEPNIAHKTIQKITETYGKNNVYHITQNVTDLNERAGGEVLHVHGELIKMECDYCSTNWEIGYDLFDPNESKCPTCNNRLSVRPHIVFYGSQAPFYTYMFRAMDYLNHPETIVIVIGTQGNVIPVDAMIKGTKAIKILANMEASEDLPEKRYSKIYYESIETSILKIEKDIAKVWDNEIK